MSRLGDSKYKAGAWKSDQHAFTSIWEGKTLVLDRKEAHSILIQGFVKESGRGEDCTSPASEVNGKTCQWNTRRELVNKQRSDSPFLG